jgi:hypothetical protein
MHVATAAILRYFAYDHLPEGPLRTASLRCHALAHGMANDLPSGPELTAGLRKLLEAKDCFVRAALGSPKE